MRKSGTGQAGERDFFRYDNNLGQLLEAVSRFYLYNIINGLKNALKVTSQECARAHRGDTLRAMINKFVAPAEAALADIPDGATVMLGGFGNAGMATELIDALIQQ